MKNTLLKLLCLVLCLAMFAGCGGSEESAPESAKPAPTENTEPEPELADLTIADTAWSFGEDYYYFFADDSFLVDEGGDTAWGDYIWDGQSGAATIGDVTVALYVTEDGFMLDADGDEYLLDYAGPVDKINFSEEPLDLADSAWGVEDISYYFYSDGTMQADANGIIENGGYEWDGLEGSMHMQGVEYAMYVYEGDLYLEGEDGADHQLIYQGLAAKPEGDYILEDNGDGTVTYTDYIRNVTFKCPAWMTIIAEGIGDSTDAVLVADDEGGYVMGDNMTNEWWDYDGTNSEFLLEYINSYIPEFFVPLYGDWDDFTIDEVYDDSEGRLATYEMNIWNDDWDIQVAVLMYESGAEGIMVKTFFAPYDDDDQFQFLWDNVRSMTCI